MPTKAAYERFDADPELEFEFFLAQKLSRTVAELRAGMGQREFTEWGIFYARKAQAQELELAKVKGE